MSDYNDGKWHGWNGGECPVHPESKIDAIFIKEDGAIFKGSSRAVAGDWNWDAKEKDGPLIAFRVVKEYREPREWWIVPMSENNTAEEAQEFIRKMREDYPNINFDDMVHVREVLP